ncbi:carbohydrate kinase family protein [Streptomyces sp. NPDC046805]|uniref:carbohydrate kinase family protein n=1 Tax=Streptomyces sp. NPDC046805 TaxID=3155134 RepID=UPI0033C1260E
MQRISVIGNISRDQTRYPDGHGNDQLGGAALHVARAAIRAGARATPVSVIGGDLRSLPHHPALSGVDWTALRVTTGPSARFVMHYDERGRLLNLKAAYGASSQLTDHAVDHITRHPRDLYHVCCRRPLNVPQVLKLLTDSDIGFSVDFFLSSADELIGEAAPWLPHASWIFANAREYALLDSVFDASVLGGIVVTDGPRPVRLISRGSQVAEATPPATAPVEVTGAGDTLTGTYLARIACGNGMSAALEAAVDAASRHTTAPPLMLHRN